MSWNSIHLVYTYQIIPDYTGVSGGTPKISVCCNQNQGWQAFWSRVALQLDLKVFCSARLAVACCKAGKRVKQQQLRGKRCFHGAPHVVQASDSDWTIPEIVIDVVVWTNLWYKKCINVLESKLYKSRKPQCILIQDSPRLRLVIACNGKAYCACWMVDHLVSEPGTTSFMPWQVYSIAVTGWGWQSRFSTSIGDNNALVNRFLSAIYVCTTCVVCTYQPNSGNEWPWLPFWGDGKDGLWKRAVGRILGWRREGPDPRR